MQRRVFTILSAMSIIICLTACAAWVRSSVVPDRLGWIELGPESDGDVERQVVLWSSKGGAAIWWETDRRSQHGWTAHPRTFFHDSQNIVFTYPYMDGGLAANRLGFRFFDKSTHLSFGQSGPYDVERRAGVIFPYWFIGAISAILPVIWMVRTIRKPHSAGVCPKCGYDLRATPDRCPECGTETGGKAEG
jgi:hypothetical protein